MTVLEMRCVVLLSTFNGSAYIAEQLTSILSQLPTEGLVLIRDDGSRDATVAVIESMSDSRIRLLKGANLGFARSFFSLMQLAPRDADMYMLADQDDVWLPQKIQRAWAQVSRSGDVPFLYCTDTQLVDSALRPLGVGRKRISQGDLLAALTDNQVTGCTVAMNAALLEMALPDADVVGDVHFHDWWLYAVATAFGDVFCDHQPTLLYRQHGQNQVGAGAGWLKYVRMLSYLRRNNWLMSLTLQVQAFRKTHGSRLSPVQHDVLDTLHRPSGGLRRWALLFSPRCHRASITGEFLFRLLLAVDWRKMKKPAVGR